MPLTAEALERIRQRWEANLPETCTVLPQRQTRGLAGAEDEISYPDPSDPLLTAFRCRWKPEGVRTAVIADQEQSLVTGKIQCPVSTRITPTDRLYVAGVDASGPAWAITLEVDGPLGPRTWEAVREVACVQVPVPVTPVVD